MLIDIAGCFVFDARFCCYTCMLNTFRVVGLLVDALEACFPSLGFYRMEKLVNTPIFYKFVQKTLNKSLSRVYDFDTRKKFVLKLTDHDGLRDLRDFAAKQKMPIKNFICLLFKPVYSYCYRNPGRRNEFINADVTYEGVFEIIRNMFIQGIEGSNQDNANTAAKFTDPAVFQAFSLSALIDPYGRSDFIEVLRFVKESKTKPGEKPEKFFGAMLGAMILAGTAEFKAFEFAVKKAWKTLGGKKIAKPKGVAGFALGVGIFAAMTTFYYFDPIRNYWVAKIDSKFDEVLNLANTIQDKKIKSLSADQKKNINNLDGPPVWAFERSESNKIRKVFIDIIEILRAEFQDNMELTNYYNEYSFKAFKDRAKMAKMYEFFLARLQQKMGAQEFVLNNKNFKGFISGVDLMRKEAKKVFKNIRVAGTSLLLPYAHPFGEDGENKEMDKKTKTPGGDMSGINPSTQQGGGRTRLPIQKEEITTNKKVQLISLSEVSREAEKNKIISDISNSSFVIGESKDFAMKVNNFIDANAGRLFNADEAKILKAALQNYNYNDNNWKERWQAKSF